MKNVSDKSCGNNQNIFPENRACYKIMWRKYGRAREVTDENITQRCIFPAG
jgi:hypothetical protein